MRYPEASIDVHSNVCKVRIDECAVLRVVQDVLSPRDSSRWRTWTARGELGELCVLADELVSVIALAADDLGDSLDIHFVNRRTLYPNRPLFLNIENKIRGDCCEIELGSWIDRRRFPVSKLILDRQRNPLGTTLISPVDVEFVGVFLSWSRISSWGRASVVGDDPLDHERLAGGVNLSLFDRVGTFGNNMASVGFKVKRQGSGHSAKVKSVRSLVQLLNDRVLLPGTTKNVSIIVRAPFELIVTLVPCQRVVTCVTKELVVRVSTEKLIISSTAPENAN